MNNVRINSGGVYKGVEALPGKRNEFEPKHSRLAEVVIKLVVFILFFATIGYMFAALLPVFGG